MAGQRIRGYFAFLLVVFSILTLSAWIISFGIWSSYSRYEDRLQKNRSAAHFLKRSAVPAPKTLDQDFWKKFDIAFEDHFEKWQRGINDFAEQVYYPLPALMARSEKINFRWEVMPLPAEGIGQSISLQVKKGLFSCPAEETKPISIWFDNGESVPFSIQKCLSEKDVFATDPTQSIKLSGTLRVGASPVLLSQGREAVRLRSDKTASSQTALEWYRKICNPEQQGKDLLDHIQGWYIQATALNQDSLENVEWGRAPVKVTNFLPFA